MVKSAVFGLAQDDVVSDWSPDPEDRHFGCGIEDGLDGPA